MVLYAPAVPSRFNRAGLAADIPPASPALEGVTWTYSDVGSATYTGRVDRCNGAAWAMIVPPSGTYAPLRVATRQLVPVATRAMPPYGATTPLSDGVATAGTGRLRHVVLETAHGIVLAFSNFYNNGGTETDGPNDITVKAAFEPINGQKIPVTFGGQSSVVINPGGTAYCDPIGVTVVKGAFCWTDTYVLVGSAGQKWPQGGFSTLSGRGEGHTYAAPGSDLTAVGSSTAMTTSGTRIFAPAAILGLLPASLTPLPSVVLVTGDSIAAGTGDAGTTLTFGNDSGWVARWLNNQYLYHSVAFPSETVDAWFAASGINKRRCRAVAERVGATHAISELGVNSLTQALASLLGPHLIGDGQKGIWSALAAMGVTFWQSTITPQTTSTDGWSSTGNQTVSNAGNETNRKAVNAWLRDGAPITAAPSAGGVFAATGTVGALRAGSPGHPLAGILEVADLVETARDSGIFKAGRKITDAAITSGQTTLTSATAAFTGADQGEAITVMGAGAAGAVLTGAIDTVTNGTTVTLTASAGTTVSGAVAGIGVYTMDGTHPSATGHRVIAAGLPTPASLGLVAAP